jgi:sec-independent protein translocase protein TatB
MLSIPHMIVVFIIVLVVFGPNKLPELARGLGKLMAEFRKASTDFKSAFEQEMRDIERQTVLAERKKAAEAAAVAVAAAPQPATLGTPPSTETQGAGSTSASATDAVKTDANPTGDADTTPPDRRATEALVATPVVEAVARGLEHNTAGIGHSNNGIGHTTEPQITLDSPDRTAAPQQGSAAAVADNDPAHDTQQPA